MAEEEQKKEKILWGRVLTVVGVPLIVIGLIIYFGVILPNKEKKELEKQKQEEAQRKEEERIKNYNTCVADTESYYKLSWAKWCKDYGLDTMDESCTLPEIQEKQVKDVKQKSLETCQKLYGKEQE